MNDLFTSLRDITDRSNSDPAYFVKRGKDLLSRINQENDSLNAFLRTYFTPDLFERLFPRMREKKQGKDLFGLLFSVKDNIAVENHPLTFGLQPPLVDQSETHADVVKLCLGQGATLAGSTTLDVACINASGSNPFYGTTLNPRFKEFTTLGSSSGSAASVSSGLCDFSIGTDSGGSVRAPAAACGICGIKTSSNLLPKSGVVLLNDKLDSLGFLANQLDDLLYLLECLTDCRTEVNQDPDYKFIIPTAEDLKHMDQDFLSFFNSAVAKLAEKCSITTTSSSLNFQDASKARKEISVHSFIDLLGKYGARHQELSPGVQALLIAGKKQTPEIFQKALESQNSILKKLGNLLDSSTFILCPTLPCKPPKRSKPGKTDVIIKAKLLSFLTLANISSLPALSFPSTSERGNFPFSFQLIGSVNNDFNLIKAGQFLLSLLST